MHSKTLIALLVVAASLTIKAPAAFANSWEQYTQQGSEEFIQSNYGQAERQFKLALKEAETFGEHDLRLATSLTNLGVLYKAHAQIAKAEPLFERALLVQQNVLGANNFEVISTAAKLCHYYAQRGEWNKADALCARVFSYVEAYQNTKEHELDLAVLADGLAKSFGDRSPSERLFQIALAIRQRALPANHMAVASSSECLARLYAGRGNQSEAEPLFRRAYEISDKTLGSIKPETLSLAESYALCCQNLGKNKEAESIYRHSLEGCEHSFGKRSGYTSKVQIGLANLLSKEGRYAEAGPLLSEALKTQEAMQGPDNVSLSPILDAYADVLDRTNRHFEASKIHNRAKAIASR
jgi:tetratricopeptide (TPR) repeat protein